MNISISFKQISLHSNLRSCCCKMLQYYNIISVLDRQTFLWWTSCLLPNIYFPDDSPIFFDLYLLELRPNFFILKLHFLILLLSIFLLPVMGGGLFSTLEVGLWPFCYYSSFCWPIFHWSALIAVVIPRFMAFFYLDQCLCCLLEQHTYGLFNPFCLENRSKSMTQIRIV